MSFEQVARWIEAHQGEMIELQSELTARPALGPENGGDGEWEKARFLEQYLAGLGLTEVQHYDCPDERTSEGTRPNFAVSLPALSQAPCVCVLTHLDVVPPGERMPDGTWKGWDADPYQLRHSGDLLIGRGVCDNQQAIVSAVFAARALMECGVKPPSTVRLLFVSDEETGSHYGLWHLLREPTGIFARQDAIIVPDWGEPDGTTIEIAEKSALWLEFRVRGRQAHGSRPDLAVNAFRAGSALVQAVDEALHARFEKVNHLYDVPRSTFEPTVHQANVPNVNTIPAEDVFCFDCRVLPDYELDAVLAAVEAQCRSIDGVHRTQTELVVRNRQDAPPPTPSDASVVQLLAAAIRQVHGVEPATRGIGGMTVASPFREKGFPAAVWSTAEPTAHQVNETCRLSHMVADAKVLAHVYMSGL